MTLILTLIQKFLTMQILDKFTINNIPLENQQRFAKILIQIDSKIDNNNKINYELEEMAKTIYDYWFLESEFPDEEGKPYKSSGDKMVWNKELKRDLPKLMIALYDEVCNTDIEKSKEYEAQCLDIWDLMFENRIGITRDLTEKLTEM